MYELVYTYLILNVCKNFKKVKLSILVVKQASKTTKHTFFIIKYVTYLKAIK